MKKEDTYNGFKIIHNVPDLSKEQKEEIKQDILKKLCNTFNRKIGN